MEENNVKDLLALLVGRVKLSSDDSEEFVKAMFGVIRDGLMRDRVVKIKGLGTFKVVDIDPRESVSVNTGERVTIEGHGKVVFTPDATMKELVNKPFSQFETVILNDGVTFSEDAETEVVEKETIAETEDTDEARVIASSDKQQENDIVEVPLKEEKVEVPPVEEKAAPISEDENADSQVDTFEMDEPSIDMEACGDEHEEAPARTLEAEVNPFLDDEDDEESQEPHEPQGKGNVWKMVALHFVGCLLLMGVSGYAGYLLGTQERSKSVGLPVYEEQPQKENSVAEETKAKVDTVAYKDTLVKVEATKQDVERTDTTTDYGRMDVRVRTGAYRIVGTNRVITVKAGETVKSISERTLGPGMECYVEVYNGLSSDAQLKAGQTLKIPDLKLKRRQGK